MSRKEATEASPKVLKSSREGLGELHVSLPSGLSLSAPFYVGVSLGVGAHRAPISAGYPGCCPFVGLESHHSPWGSKNKVGRHPPIETRSTIMTPRLTDHVSAT